MTDNEKLFKAISILKSNAPLVFRGNVVNE